ncbi:MAG: large conductance mechanosensitive channel protein MscL [Sphingobacteriales bacterium]|nr:MAG: large conductance mechanosensitive channel protein MscL [Sphingobacteriales bacterium]
MGFIQDFKSFAVKGNVIDLAVGVVIGAAFGKIVTAAVDDIIMPFIGRATGEGKKFTDKFYVLKAGKEGDVYKSLQEAKAAAANVFAYGDFIQTIVDFLIIAFCIFLFIKIFNRFKAKEEAKTVAALPAPTHTEKLLTEIRDLLKK